LIECAKIFRGDDFRQNSIAEGHHDHQPNGQDQLRVEYRQETQQTQDEQLNQLKESKEMDLSLRNLTNVVIRWISSLERSPVIITNDMSRYLADLFREEECHAFEKLIPIQ
jgi:hypothetical protein